MDYLAILYTCRDEAMCRGDADAFNAAERLIAAEYAFA